MTAARDYDDLHSLVDRLTPDQAQALRAVALQLVVSDSAEQGATSEPIGEQRGRLSFEGSTRTEPDLVVRSQEKRSSARNVGGEPGDRLRHRVLVALLDDNDKDHRRCLDLLELRGAPVLVPSSGTRGDVVFRADAH
ncbi:hypothetical protein AB0C34_30735 [Nocardia sp. NPDC049220]|uniref:hypothetical protein n=1 Tax=Nocardia sp. NPDC049220 TaxID=3155273 RepID=UPI0033DC362D